MTALVTIECRGPQGSRTRTVLLDGEVLLTTSRDVIRTIGLKSGAHSDGAVLVSQVHEYERACAESRSLKLLNYRERTRAELERRLAEDGFSTDCASQVLDRLEDLEFLSDVRFADSYTRGKARAGWGTRRIRNGLKQAGVLPEIAERAIETEYPGTDDERALEHAIASRPLSDSDVKRVMSRLVRRGYSESTARRAAFEARNRTRAECEDPSSS